MTKSPKKQGDMDGQCGVYAIVNALSELAQGINSDDIFRKACKALPKARWPEVLWNGTTLRDLEVMLKSFEEELADLRITVRHPFRSNQPSSDSAFWESFNALFHENFHYKRAIIGLEEPSFHWLVAKPGKDSLTFIDSDSTPSRRCVARENIYAGQRRNSGQEYRVNRKEVILFEKIG